MPTRSLEKAHPWMDWFTHERRNWIGAMVASGLIGFAVANGHTTQNSIQAVSQQLGQKQAELHKLQTIDIPKLKAQSKCEHARANIIGNEAVDGDVQTPKDLPSDDCPHAK